MGADSGAGGYDSVCGKMRNKKRRACSRAMHFPIILPDIDMLCYLATRG